MANDCSWEMNVIGTSRKDVINFMDALDRDYSNGKHLWRVWEVNYEEENIKKVGPFWCGYCYGSCAWSVHTCMMDGAGTYQQDNRNPTTGTLEDPSGSTLMEFAQMFNVTVEVYSSEPGFAFEEHYLINNNGDELINECVDAECIYWNPDDGPLEDLNKEMGTNYEEEDFDDCGSIQISGFRTGQCEPFPFLAPQELAESHIASEWDIIDGVIKDIQNPLLPGEGE